MAKTKGTRGKQKWKTIRDSKGEIMLLFKRIIFNVPYVTIIGFQRLYNDQFIRLLSKNKNKQLQSVKKIKLLTIF